MFYIVGYVLDFCCCVLLLFEIVFCIVKMFGYFIEK